MRRVRCCEVAHLHFFLGGEDGYSALYIIRWKSLSLCCLIVFVVAAWSGWLRLYLEKSIPDGVSDRFLWSK